MHLNIDIVKFYRQYSKSIIKWEKALIKRTQKIIKEREAKIMANKNLEKNNNIVIDLLIKSNKLIQSLTTLLDLVNSKDSQELINDKEILTAETYGKVQEFLITCIGAVNKEVGEKFVLLNTKEKEAK